MKELYLACKNVLIGFRTQDAASKAMEEKIEAALKIENPVEKLLEVTALSKENQAGIKGKFLNDKNVDAFTILGAAASLFVIGAASVVFPVLSPLMYVPCALIPAIILPTAIVRSRDASLRSRQQSDKKLEAVINDIVRNADPLPFARSEKFDILMTHFPELKERFLLASAKEAVLAAATKATKNPSFSAGP